MNAETAVPKWKLAPGFRRVDADVGIFAYNSILGNLGQLSDREIQIIAAVESDTYLENADDRALIERLREATFIQRPDEPDEYHIIEPRIAGYYERLHSGETLTKLLLIVTEDCMLRCSYCYMSDAPGAGTVSSGQGHHTPTPEILNSNVYSQKLVALPSSQELRTGASTTFRSVPGRMSWDIAKRSLDLFYELIAKYGTREVHVRFHGGEPFICWDLIRRSIEYIETEYGHLDVRTMYRFNSNGVPISEEVAAFLAKRETYVEISVDGPREIHNKLRPYLNGKGSFDQAITAIKRLLDAGLPEENLNFAVTLNRENYQCFRELVDLTVDLGMSHLEINVFYFQHKLDLLRDDSEVKTRVAVLIDAMLYGATKGVALDGKPYKLFSRLENPVINYCGRFGQQIGVDTSGNIVGCSGHLEPLGHIDNYEEFLRNPRYEKATRRVLGTIPDCRGCDIEGMCGGGCMAEADRSYGDFYFADRKECDFRRLMVKSMIERIGQIKKEGIETPEVEGSYYARLQDMK